MASSNQQSKIHDVNARRVIRYDTAVTDHWEHLTDEEPLPESGAVIVSLARWRSDRAALGAFSQQGGQVGVRLETHHLADEIAADLDALPLVALHVHKFVDGRFYSTARLLRMRHGFRGEIRACGDVLPDQLLYMRRCGIDTFELRADKRIETGLRALRAFTVAYQGAEDRPPLYRLRESRAAREPAA